MPDFNPQQLTRLDQDRLKAYRDNLDFYSGSQWLQRTRERQLVFNYAKVSVDKVTSYLMTGFGFACDPLEDTPQAKSKARAAEKALRQVHDDNNLSQLDYETEVDTAILGDGAYKVIWDPREKKIKVTAPDVQGLYCWWLGDDTSTVWRVASKYSLSAEEVAMLYNFKSTGQRSTLVEVWTKQDFDLYLDNNLFQRKPNPYGFIPFIIFPNLKAPKQFWGTSDIPPLIESQRELNRALSQLSHILELSGNPIAVLENITEAEDIAVKPGAVWTIPEDAKAYLLDLLQGGGVRLHIEYIDLIYRCLHDISEAPRAAYGGTERELSGVALEVELHSLLQKVRRKRTIRAGAYRKRNQMIIKLLEKYSSAQFGELNHRPIWGPILPQDKARQAQNEQLLVQSGVHSRRRAMDELGVEDPEQEFNNWLEERKRILEMNRQFQARSTRGGEREREFAAEMPSVPE